MLQTVLALPGLHGSTALFDSFAACSPPAVELITVPLDPTLSSYEDLASQLLPSCPTGDCWLVAESFSGPLAVRLATQLRVQGLTLCASFISAPLPSLLRHLPWPYVFRRTPSRRAIATMMTGGDGVLADRVIAEVASLSPNVLAGRVEAALTADVRQLVSCAAYPITYVQATYDRLVPPSAARQLTRTRQSARVVPVHAPHLVVQTAPMEVWDAITMADRGLTRV